MAIDCKTARRSADKAKGESPIHSALRRLALNLVKWGKSLKIGVAAKLKRAVWDLEYLRAILRLAQ